MSSVSAQLRLALVACFVPGACAVFQPDPIHTSLVLQDTAVLIALLLVIFATGYWLGKRKGWVPQTPHWRILCVVIYFAVGLIYGLVGNHSDEVGEHVQWTVGDSLYWIVVTVTTVGYGDVAPASRAGKIFACFYILLGLAIVADALGSFVDYLVEQQDRLFKEVLKKSAADAEATVHANANTLKQLALDIKESIHNHTNGGDDLVGIAYVKKIFADYDDDDSNCLDKEELFKAIQEGLKVTHVGPEEFELLWPIIDDDGSGSVDCDEFIELCMASNPEAKAMQAFSKAQADRVVADMHAGHRKAIVLALAQFVCLVALGTLAMVNLEKEQDWTTIDGIYWSVVTITTVGYGDMDVNRQGSRWFCVFYILFSVFLMARVLGVVSQVLLDRKAARQRDELMAIPLNEEAIANMDKDGDGEVDSGEFLMAMLVSADIVDEAVCQAYLEKFADLDISGDGLLSKEDMVVGLEAERQKQQKEAPLAADADVDADAGGELEMTESA